MRRLLGLLALVIAACGSSDEPDSSPLPPVLEPAVPLPECPEHDYEVCDVRNADCQQRLASLAACIRGSEPVADLPIDVLSEAEYAEKIRQDLADTPEPAVDHFERALSMLQLAPETGTTRAEDIANRVENVLGVYYSDEKRIIIIDHGKPADTAYIDATLVHEFVHALQDVDYDLSNWQQEAALTFDVRLALRSVVEGEASFLDARAAVPLLGIDIAEVDFDSAMREYLSAVEDEIAESKSRYRDSYATFPYGFGAIRAYRAWLEGGLRGLEAAWASPPRTTQQILSEQLGLNTPQESGVEISEPVVEGLALTTRDTLGAWGLSLFLAARNEREPQERALSWRGDQLSVFTDTVVEGEPSPNAPRTYLLWQLELDSESMAQALAQAASSSCRGASFGTRAMLSCDGSLSPVGSDLYAWGESWLREE
jgi:hypothetical protein